jgi:hypothetical protein
MRRPPPYHRGSIICSHPPVQPPLPGHQEYYKQSLFDCEHRVRSYWPRPNAAAWKVAHALIDLCQIGAALYPTLKLIAHRAAVCLKTAWRWVTAFAAAGFLNKILRRTADGHQTSTAYTIRFPSNETLAAEPAARVEQPFPSLAANCPSNGTDYMSQQESVVEAPVPMWLDRSGSMDSLRGRNEEPDLIERFEALVDVAERRFRDDVNAKRRERYRNKGRGLRRSGCRLHGRPRDVSNPLFGSSDLCPDGA